MSQLSDNFQKAVQMQRERDQAKYNASSNLQPGQYTPTDIRGQNPYGALSPEYNSLVETAQRNADQYGAQLPGMQQRQYDIAADEGRLNLAKSLTGADRSANAHGMLYGQKHAGMRAQAESGMASNLAAQRRGINADTRQTSEDLESAALQAGLKRRSDLQALNNQNYENQAAQAAGKNAKTAQNYKAVTSLATAAALL